jgi:hypothetical protein
MGNCLIVNKKPRISLLMLVSFQYFYNANIWARKKKGTRKCLAKFISRNKGKERGYGNFNLLATNVIFLEPNTGNRFLSSHYRVGSWPHLDILPVDLLIFFYSTVAGALFLLCKQIKRKGRLSKLHSESIVQEMRSITSVKNHIDEEHNLGKKSHWRGA